MIKPSPPALSLTEATEKIENELVRVDAMNDCVVAEEGEASQYLIGKSLALNFALRVLRQVEE